ncbi:unnamed protein product [Enterobius vermicularis]|uniref:Uncharacterized protein n=1 Tax=Enterobius vermicularis TaxID=51028 RepID=A0A0N4UWN3_ENTVE|nr:unnamed protein product [Enterobius vermicularis]
MSTVQDNDMVFDWKAVGKAPARSCFCQPQNSLYRETSIVKLVSGRELFGPVKKLSNIRYRVVLNTMLLPKVKDWRGNLDSYMKQLWFPAYGAFNRFILRIVLKCSRLLEIGLFDVNLIFFFISKLFLDFCSSERILVVAVLTPTSIIPSAKVGIGNLANSATLRAFGLAGNSLFQRYTISVRERRPLDNFYASFSKDSSVISVLVSPKLPCTEKIEPFFFDANIYLLNLKHGLSLNLSATIRASCRWQKHKLDRVCLRSTDYGAVLNSGLSITTFIFLDSLPPALNVFRAKVFRLKRGRGQGYERSLENMESSVVMCGVRKMKSFIYPVSEEEDYSLELLQSERIDSYTKKGVYFVMSTTEIASFIKSGTNKLLRYFSFNVDTITCVDYELDIIECTSDYWIYSMITTLIEVKTDGRPLLYVGVFSMNINALTTSDVSVWRKLRAVDVSEAKGTIFPCRRDRWYPFNDKRVKSVEERLVSDECLTKGRV